MKAIVLNGHGSADIMAIGEVGRPTPAADEVLIRVEATSINRPDIIQREGRYPPPPGASEILGLDAAGTISETGADVTEWRVGDRVTALLSGGGYGQFATAHTGHVLAIPKHISFEQAACIPEAYITAFQNLFINTRLANGETVLLHGGGGGVNTAAIQICKALVPDSCVIVTASPHKLERVKAIGANDVIDYVHEDFAERVQNITDKRGADVILDHIGAAYFGKNCASLAIGGRLVIIATLSGREAQIDLGRLMVKRQSIVGSVLRSRPTPEKAAIVRQFREQVMGHFDAGEIMPVIDRVMPLEQAADAHRLMESSGHFGKIVLRVLHAD